MKSIKWNQSFFAVLLFCMTSLSMAEEVTEYRGMGIAKDYFPTFQYLKLHGFIAKKPDIKRYDYNDVYNVKKPLSFKGQNVVLLTDEYMSEYVGCCVSEGWGAVIAKTFDLAPLKQFAKKNQCSLSIRDKSNVDYYGLILKKLPKAEYYELSCRERDLNE